MISIKEYIFEKFKIGKDIETPTLLTDKAFDEAYMKPFKEDPKNRFVAINHYAEKADDEKMEYYHDKHSKPERLVSTIKNDEKLERRFHAAMKMKWEDAINVFGQALIDRKLYSEEVVLLLINKYYKR